MFNPNETAWNRLIITRTLDQALLVVEGRKALELDPHPADTSGIPGIPIGFGLPELAARLAEVAQALSKVSAAMEVAEHAPQLKEARVFSLALSKECNAQIETVKQQFERVQNLYLELLKMAIQQTNGGTTQWNQ